MPSSRLRPGLLPTCALILIGLLATAGCASSKDQHPTLAALLPPPTHPTATPTPVELSIPEAPSSPAPTSVPRLTVVPNATASPAATPTPTPDLPTPFPWLLAYDSDTEGNDDIYLLPADGGSVVNITHDAAEDRHPAWSPDGSSIAFQSNRDGNWEIYTLDLQDGKLERLTFHLAYDGAPSWSSDGRWILFESYRDTSPCQMATPVPNPPPCPDLEIYRVPSEGGVPQRLTDSPGGDSQPVWSPDGAWIAFASWRDGDKEIYLMPANGGPVRNFTANAGDDWSPAWSPDGKALVFLSERRGVAELYRRSLDGGPVARLTFNGLPEERPTWWPDGSLLYARYDPGPAFETHNSYRPGAYHLYRWRANDEPLQPLLPLVKARHPAAAPRAAPPAASITGATGKPESRMYPAGSLPELELTRLDDLEAPDPRLVSGVDKAFRAWRTAVFARSGNDFLGRVSDVFRPAAYYSHRLGYLSWHKTGRAVDLLFDWRDAQGKDALYIVRENVGGEVYWRLYLKCAVQDGTLGEPLTQAPWYFWWHYAPAGHPEAAENGGKRLPIPAGYFVDVTALAERYGWSRIASYHLDDFHWQRDSTATEYWHYQHTDGLTWYQAMSQIYPQDVLAELFSRPIAAAREQTEEVMDSKGLPRTDLP
jgi:hypothetical protein